MPEPTESSLKGKGLEIGKSRLRGSLLAGRILENTVEVATEVDETAGGEPIRYNHPEVFQDLNVTPIEEPERVTYEIPDVGVLSLLRIDDYGGKHILQVDIAEVDDDKLGRGFGTDMYRYVANHLPTGYQGILSGTVTHEAIHHIYETFGKEPGLFLHKIGSGIKPSLYLLEAVERDS
jgi:hypothetical protein